MKIEIEVEIRNGLMTSRKFRGTVDSYVHVKQTDESYVGAIVLVTKEFMKDEWKIISPPELQCYPLEDLTVIGYDDVVDVAVIPN
ncbi:hypothetical protein P9VFCI_131 [Rhizobium phage P9VFCI]|uniref:Uncharacterized protein n=1 Tax=Rhizobium phage P9VFCI TaxID=2763531 RepID=A0A7G7WXM2_9CAUD|nr:hypothetical protein PP937_gp131 [Rhizobium phage P9VFCI]QNH71966.1 hypothetical protein P9VFCI_131 [Rhizobium phage P9VFCI]